MYLEQKPGGSRKRKSITFIAVVLLLISLPVSHLIAKKLTSADYYGVSMNEEFPDFEGLDGNAQPIQRDDFKGRLHLVFMGNTRCGSICYPRILLFKEISAIFDKDYPDLHGKVEFNFFTIDPENDRPSIMKAYFDDYMHFAKSVIVDQKSFFEKLSKNLGVRFTYKGNGQFDHADYLYLVDEELNVRLMYGGQKLNASLIAGDIKKIVTDRSITSGEH